MKTQCDIVRDLMPLCIDEAASAESTKYVDEHVAECEECKSYYEKMKAVIPDRECAKEVQEQAEFGKAAELMKLKHRLRVRRNVFIGILIGMLAVAGIYIGWQGLAVNFNGEIPKDQYSVSLAQLKDGRVIGSVNYQKSKRIIGGIFTERGTRNWDKSADSAENPYLLRLWITTTLIPRYMKSENRNGRAFILNNIDEVDLIKVGKKEDLIIWKRGDVIARASEEMEAFYQAEEEFTQYLDMFNRELVLDDTEMNEENKDAWNRRKSLFILQEQLRQQVPEWQ